MQSVAAKLTVESIPFRALPFLEMFSHSSSRQSVANADVVRTFDRLCGPGNCKTVLVDFMGNVIGGKYVKT